jgi:hypothetical protein
LNEAGDSQLADLIRRINLQWILQLIDELQKQPKVKSAFTPQREMITTLRGTNGAPKPAQGTLF